MQSRILALPIAEREEAIEAIEKELKAGTFNVLAPFKKTVYQRCRDQYFAGLNASVTGSLVGGMAVFLTAAALPAVAVSATVLIGGGMLATKRWKDAQQAIKDEDFGYLMQDEELEELEELIEEMGKPANKTAKLALKKAREIVEEELGEPVDVSFVEVPDYEEQEEYTAPNPWNESALPPAPRAVDVSDDELAEQEKQCAAAGIRMADYRRVVEGWPLSLPAPTPADVAPLIYTKEPVSAGVSESFSQSFENVSMRVFSPVSDSPETFQPSFETVSNPVSEEEQAEVESLLLEFAPHQLSIANLDTVFSVKEALRIGRSEKWIRTQLFEGIAPGGSKRYEEFKAIVELAQQKLNQETGKV